MEVMTLSKLLTLVGTKLRKTTERAVEWLTKGRYQTLFLDLPEDLTSFVNEYSERRISKEEFWQSYGYLTGIQEPYINALRYRMDSLLEALPDLKNDVPGLEVYCYQDLQCHIDACNLSEKSLLLETCERVRSKVKTDAWRQLLEEQLELSAKRLARIMENISIRIGAHPWNAILYGGEIKSFKQSIEKIGHKVKVIHLHDYWRSPLEVLGNMARSWGIHNLSDDLISGCVESQLRYLDYVLSSRDVDSAHEKWVSDTLPFFAS
nr:MAG: hypothetical protein AM324_00890 [Candidatus Thorarchaeota archaeon SMTZ1-83]